MFSSGRPIVKGGGGNPQSQQQPQQFPQHFSSNIDYQQQQQQQQQRIGTGIYGSNASRSKHTLPGQQNVGLQNIPPQFSQQQQQSSNSMMAGQRQQPDPLKQMRHPNIFQEELALQQQMRAVNSPQTLNQAFNSARNGE